MGDIYALLYGAAGGGVAGLVLALIGGSVLYNLKKSLQELDSLKERRMAALERKIEDHLEKDNPPLVSKCLDDLSKSMEKIANDHRYTKISLDEINRKVTELEVRTKEDIKAKDVWIGNINTALEAHRNDRSIHHGK